MCKVDVFPQCAVTVKPSLKLPTISSDFTTSQTVGGVGGVSPHHTGGDKTVAVLEKLDI